MMTVATFLVESTANLGKAIATMVTFPVESTANLTEVIATTAVPPPLNNREPARDQVAVAPGPDLGGPLEQ
jgi:hypothetical protein